jgi:hypothetical protein
MFILCFSFVSAFSLRTNIEHYYKFDINANDNVGSVNGFVIGATLTTDSGGKINETYYIDGVNDYIAFNNLGMYSDGFTLCAWINKDQTNNYLMYSTNIGTINVFNLGTHGNVIGYYDGTWRDSTQVLGIGFHHVCWVFDGVNSYDLYYNGNNVQTLTYGGTVDLSGIVSISRQSNPSDFKGMVDELALWSRALTTPEITELYNNGSGLQYPFTTVYEPIIITAVNTYDLEAILNFTANIQGVGNYSTTNGTIITGLYSNDTSLYNITINSNSSGGYFEKTYNSYNVSSDLNAGLYQSEIRINLFSIIFNDSLSNFTLEHAMGSNSTSSGSVVLYPSAGYYSNWNFTSLQGDYFDLFNQSFNITPLLNTTLSFYRAYDSLLNVSAFDYSTNTSINSFFASINFNNSYLLNSSNVSGLVLFPVMRDLNYFIFMNATGFVVSNSTVNVSSVSVLENFSLFPENSVSFSIFNLDSLLLVNTSVDITMHGNLQDYTFSTSNGVYFIQDVIPDHYEVTFSGGGYDFTILYLNLVSGTHMDVDAYMKNAEFIEFIVTDNLAEYVSNATLTFTQLINGSIITIGQVKTDFSGRASIYLSSNITYSFFVSKTGYDTFTGFVVPTQSTYNINIEQSGSSPFISVFYDLKINYGVNYVAGSNLSSPFLIVSSASGGLEYYGMSLTYNATSYFVNTSGIPAGGTEFFNVSIFDASVFSFLNVSYFVKYTGRDVIEWNVLYPLSNSSFNINTASTGLFDDIRALPDNSIIKGVLGMLIIVTFIIIFSSTAGLLGIGGKNTEVVTGGVFGLFVCSGLGLYSTNILIISLVSIIVIISVENLREVA